MTLHIITEELFDILGRNGNSVLLKLPFQILLALDDIFLTSLLLEP